MTTCGFRGSVNGATWHDFARRAPMTRAFNHLIAGAHFARRFGRWPLPASDPRATINDYIFGRMIDPDWSALERAFVDKEWAKSEARRLAPDLHVPATLAVIAMATLPTVDLLHEALRPFAGTPAIAKPAHASGCAIFLRDLASGAQLVGLHALGARDYAHVLREMQYNKLDRKIIVEAVIPTADGQPPDDYKFHCVRGEPLVCQVDHNRFGTPWNRLLRIPDLAPFNAQDGLLEPPSFRRPSADRIALMLEAARALSAPFEFVRVDLYDGREGIYFGELTFTPAASLGVAPAGQGDHAVNPTHLAYSELMMAALTGRALLGDERGQHVFG